MRITGTMIHYYFICHRKLWLNWHHLSFEAQHENVQLGKLLDQSSYARENKQIMIDGVINIDFLENWKIIHEVKKSRAMEESAQWQVKYYLYYLREKGIAVDKGILDYPLLKQRETVELNDDDVKELQTILIDIENICCQQSVPPVTKQQRCKKCAFYEYCYV